MRLGAALALVILLAAPRSALARTPDPWITTKIKIALFTSEALGARGVNVDTVDGRVTLHGKTASSEERARAETIARSVQGVREVRNLLQVVPASRHEKTQATDQWIQSEVSERVAKVAEGHITVASVHDGVVLLAGEARNSAEHLRAIELARRVRGVRRVASEVRTAANETDLDVWNGHELRQGGESLMDAASDIWMTAEVRLALYAEDDISTADISVDTRNGIVTLFGSVPTEDQKDEAEDEAEDVDGVRKIRNLLQVVPAQMQESIKKTDAELEARVNQAIYARPEMKRLAVRVSVRKRFVRLSGTVPSQQHRVAVAAAARSVPGVRAVNSEDLEVMTITQTQPQTPAPTPRR